MGDSMKRLLTRQSFYLVLLLSFTALLFSACQGVNGAVGKVGSKGDSGPAGPPGVIGGPGPQGSVGATGATGPTGLEGTKGPKGDSGVASVASVAIASSIGVGNSFEVSGSGFASGSTYTVNVSVSGQDEFLLRVSSEGLVVNANGALNSKWKFVTPAGVGVYTLTVRDAQGGSATAPLSIS